MSELKLLTFELNSDGDEIDIHCNEVGLYYLKDIIENLLNNIKLKKDHSHLMTKSWGGDGLTEEKQSSSSTLLHKVTFHAWSSN